MSQVLGPNDPFESYQRPSGSNPLGIVGFILAFCLSPIGLIISLIALTKQPRGFAIAGVIIGLLGSGVWACFGWGYAMFGKFGAQVVELGAEYKAIDESIANYQATNNGNLPPDLAALQLPGHGAIDPWNTQYKYEPGADGKTWSLTTAGIDAVFGTADDASFSSGMSESEVSEQIEGMTKTYLEQKFGAPQRTPRTPPTPAPAATPAPSEPAEEPAAKEEPAPADQPE